MDACVVELYKVKSAYHAMLANMGCPEYLRDDFVHDAMIKIHRGNYYSKVWSKELGVNYVYMYLILRSAYVDFNKAESRAVHFIEDEVPIEKLEAIDRIFNKMDALIRSQGSYVARLMSVKFGMDVTFRSLSKDTGIGVKTLFQSVKDCKSEIHEALKQDYKNLKIGDWDKI